MDAFRGLEVSRPLYVSRKIYVYAKRDESG